MIDFEKLADIYTQSVVHSVWAKQPSQLVLSLRKIFPWLAEFDIVAESTMRYRVEGIERAPRVLAHSAQAAQRLRVWILEYTRKEFRK